VHEKGAFFAPMRRFSGVDWDWRGFGAIWCDLVRFGRFLALVWGDLVGSWCWFGAIWCWFGAIWCWFGAIWGWFGAGLGLVWGYGYKDPSFCSGIVKVL